MKTPEELTLRIKDSDFSTFAGYYYTSSNYEENNEVLNSYIKLYKTTSQLKYFQVECDRNCSMHTIAYIINQVDEKYFIRTVHEDTAKNNKYWLCFYKEDNNHDN